MKNVRYGKRNFLRINLSTTTTTTIKICEIVEMWNSLNFYHLLLYSNGKGCNGGIAKNRQ